VSWASRIAELIDPTRVVDPEARAAFEAARHHRNVERARRLLLVAAPLHLVALTVFWPRGLDPELTWRTRLVGIHAILGAFALAALLIARVRTGPLVAAQRRLAEAATVVYALGGATIAAISHDVGYTVTGYAIALVVLAVGFVTRPAFTAVVHGLALAVLIASIAEATTDPLERQRQLINAVMIGAFAFVLSRLTFRVVLREVADRLALERLNASLEQRVADQVTEIVARARELDLLNQRLRERVADRSRELAMALERVAAAELGEAVLPPGHLLGDQYEVIRPIGVGGMGVVYAGRDRARDVPVAIKLIKGGSGVNALQRFLTEAGAAARVDHPAVVRVLHVDVSAEGRMYQVLELVSGWTLDARLHDEHTLSVAATVRLGELVGSALAAAHAQGVVHRDIKPANVMLTDQTPGVKVLDFGLAKLRGERAAAQTEGGLVIGTPEFMAPEQVNAPDRITGAADVYALGVTLFLCLTGRLPFEGRHAMTLFNAHLHDAPPDLSALAPGTPPALAALVTRCLAKPTEDRPSAEELSGALGRLAADLGAPAWTELERHRGDLSTRPIRTPDPMPARS
jgi:serine/threonine-protein kinase